MVYMPMNNTSDVCREKIDNYVDSVMEVLMSVECNAVVKMNIGDIPDEFHSLWCLLYVHERFLLACGDTGIEVVESKVVDKYCAMTFKIVKEMREVSLSSLYRVGG